MNLNMQLGHRSTAFTWTSSIDMDLTCSMDKYMLLVHAAFMSMMHIHVHAACPIHAA
jgi:hypothetical protein